MFHLSDLQKFFIYTYLLSVLANITVRSLEFIFNIWWPIIWDFLQLENRHGLRPPISDKRHKLYLLLLDGKTTEKLLIDNFNWPWRSEIFYHPENFIVDIDVVYGHCYATVTITWGDIRHKFGLNSRVKVLQLNSTVIVRNNVGARIEKMRANKGSAFLMMEVCGLAMPLDPRVDMDQIPGIQVSSGRPIQRRMCIKSTESSLDEVGV